jgi:hypothetical protein
MTIQERWQSTFEKIDRSCPARRADEASVDYLRRLSVIGKRYLPKSEQIANVTFKTLPDDVVAKFSELVREAVERQVARTDNMSKGELRPVYEVDENTGSRIRKWIGPTSFVVDMGRPCRRVTSFWNGHCYVGADGRPLR